MNKLSEAEQKVVDEVLEDAAQSMLEHDPDVGIFANHELAEFFRSLKGLDPTDLPGLTFQALREANVSRCARWHPAGTRQWSLSDWGVAAAGEMGEALNVIKKLNRARDGVVGNAVGETELLNQLADELADVVIYLDLLAASEKINLEHAITRKFNRTSEKVGFPERLI